MDIFSDILKVVWVSGKLSKWFVLKFAFFILRAKTPGTQHRGSQRHLSTENSVLKIHVTLYARCDLSK